MAGSVLDRVRTTRVVRCGAAARPGLLEPGGSGPPHGLLVDLCRAAGVAVAGPEVRVAMDFYDADPSYEAVRTGADDLFFLSGSEIVGRKLGGSVLPGPAVFYQTSALMVADGSPAQAPADLAGQPICFLQGEPAHRHLEAWFAARHLSFIRMGYQEPVEFYDAFEAQACRALAGEATALAAARLRGGPKRRNGRILPEPLATFPIIAATGIGDAAWSAAVAWTLATLVDADRPTRDWAAGGLDSLPLDAPALGLAAGWQKTLVATVGTYADIYRRTLGEASPLRLPMGPNAPAGGGGIMAAPFAE